MKTLTTLVVATALLVLSSVASAWGPGWGDSYSQWGSMDMFANGDNE